MTNLKDTKAKAKVDDAPKKPVAPLDFLMTNMHELMLNPNALGPTRSEEDIEADFDNMPI